MGGDGDGAMLMANVYIVVAMFIENGMPDRCVVF